MVRAGAPTPSKRKEKEAAAPVSAENKAEEAENKRLRDIAFSRKLLSRSRSHVRHPSLPSKTILNSDGKDIVKKGHRKSKYLFAFPGLLSPSAGGKLGELTNLDSKNPILYVEFPQGRLKLFGTIMYPKNKYLTLHFQRGAGNIVCEDCFESLVVFSQAWWIGTKEQNPEEVRFPLPKGLEQEKHVEVDFTAGAGQTKDLNRNARQPEKFEAIAQPASVAKPEVSEEAESIGKDSDMRLINQSVRQSARNAGKTLKYADSSSDSEDFDSDGSQQLLSTSLQTPKEISNELDTIKGEFSVTKASDIVIMDDNMPKRSTANIAAAGDRGPSNSKDVAMTATPTLKATVGKSAAVLKQSRLETFCHLNQALQEDTTIMLNREATVDMKAEVTTSAMKASIKSTKRPRQVQGLNEDTEGLQSNDGGDDSYVAKTTSKRRKQAKSHQGAEDVKVTTQITENSSSSKGRGKQVQDGKAKTQKNTKEKKSATASAPTPKGRKAASKFVKTSKKGSDTEEEGSDPEVASDDSEDEDYVG